MNIQRLDTHHDPYEVWNVFADASGFLAFDIGANIGQSTRVLARGFKKVIAFEPCEESFEILEVEMPHNVLPVKLAVSSQDGQIVLEEHEVSIATGQLTTSDGLHWGPLVGTRTVASRTLDKLAIDFGQPEFVKVDTEGHEVKVVEGGIDCLNKAKQVVIEIHKAENGNLIREMLPDINFYEVRHNLRITSPIRENHYWLVSM